MLPGVYLTVTGKPASEQRLVAAVLYAGPRAVITGPAALRLHRLRSPGPDVIDVLVPHAVLKRKKVVAISLTAEVEPVAPGGGVPTGVVTFMFKKKTLGTAVLTGALLVGDSLRGSLRALALDQLGWVDEALVAGRLVGSALA